MKILVSDDSELSDLECQMKGTRGDVAIEIYGVYYRPLFLEFTNVRQSIAAHHNLNNLVNLFIVNDVSLKNIIEVIKHNVKHKRYLELTPGTEWDISDWKVIYSE